MCACNQYQQSPVLQKILSDGFITCLIISNDELVTMDGSQRYPVSIISSPPLICIESEIIIYLVGGSNTGGHLIIPFSETSWNDY